MWKNLYYIVAIITITAVVMIILGLIPSYLKVPGDSYVPWEIGYVLIFLLFNFITIFPAYKIHKKLTPFYSPIKGVVLFTLFGGITGAMLGEGGNLVMIIPYSILMFIYANLYKRFTWWKVALTGYLAGTLVESGLNRSPIQVTTLMWIAFFTYPYFITKIFDNRKLINWSSLFKKTLILITISIILGASAFFFTKNNPSPPLILLAVFIPFVVVAFKR